MSTPQHSSRIVDLVIRSLRGSPAQWRPYLGSSLRSSEGSIRVFTHGASRATTLFLLLFGHGSCVYISNEHAEIGLPMTWRQRWRLTWASHQAKAEGERLRLEEACSDLSKLRLQEVVK